MDSLPFRTFDEIRRAICAGEMSGDPLDGVVDRAKFIERMNELDAAARLVESTMVEVPRAE